MAYSIQMGTGGHDWEKQNLITQKDGRGLYDSQKCRKCGVKGKVRELGRIEVSEVYSKEKAMSCPLRKRTKKIRVLHCGVFNPAFENITPNSIHEIIDAPEGHDSKNGVWVQGVGESVKLLFDEFRNVEEEE